jgi:superfamily II DNA or RNA helicase
MIDSFRSLFGNVTVKETNTEIVVSGIRAKDIIRDMDKHWKTTRISQNIFNTISGGSFSFYKFFAPEIMYILENIKLYRNRWTSVKAINSIIEAMMENTWLQNTKPIDRTTVKGRLDFRKLSNLTFTAKPYQMEYFENYSYRLDQYGLQGDLIAAAAGTGKTYITSAIAEMLDAELVVVFCPKVVLESVWVESIMEMFKAPQTIWHSGKPMEYKGQRWIICHYDAMPKLMEIFQNPNVYRNKRVVTILDESHNMNDPNSARSMQYQALVKLLGSQDNLQGSGTPVKALGAEIITLLRVVDPMFTPQVEAIFRKMYGKEASKGLDIIRHRLGVVSYKVEKGEASAELLPPIMRPYPIKVPGGERFTLPAIRITMEKFIRERADYYKARRPEDLKFWDNCVKIARSGIKDRQKMIEFDEYLYLVHLISKTPDPRFLGDEMKRANAFEKNVFEKLLPKEYMHRFRDVKSVVKYVNLKIQGEVLGRVVGGMRIEANVAMVPHIDWVGIVESTQKKTIMFTSFVEAVDAAEAHTINLGMKPVVVYGKTSHDLANTVKRFDDDQLLNPLIATYASLSTGVRLTMADTMILLNSPFRAYILEQAISRIYRLGQDSQTYVYQCVLDTGEIPNISTRSADILAWSQSQVEEIMGIKSPMVEGTEYETVAMECADAGEFDDLVILHKALSKAFEQYDIEIDKKNFVFQEPVKPMVPAWMR